MFFFKGFDKWEGIPPTPRESNWLFPVHGLLVIVSSSASTLFIVSALSLFREGDLFLGAGSMILATVSGVIAISNVLSLWVNTYQEACTEPCCLEDAGL